MCILKMSRDLNIYLNSSFIFADAGEGVKSMKETKRKHDVSFRLNIHTWPLTWLGLNIFFIYSYLS